MENNREQSEFNMSVSYLNRLNALFYLADESSMSLNVNQWFHSLYALYRELSTEMKEEEMTELEKKFKKINSLLHEYNDEIKRRGTGSVKSELYDSLHTTELKIRHVLKTSGLQLKMKRDAGSAIEDFT